VKHAFRPQDFSWEGVSPSKREDRVETDGEGYRGVTRHVITGEHGEPCEFHVRYYEVAPGGYTRLERHQHVHSVTVARGNGYAIVGSELHRIGPFDHVYVDPMTVHQFVNEGAEPFGFFCIVDAVRDRPQRATAQDIAMLEDIPALKGKTRV